MAKITLNRDLEGFNGFMGNRSQRIKISLLWHRLIPGIPSYLTNPDPDKKGSQRFESPFSPAAAGFQLQPS
jgi:hypothetical protein